MFNLRCPKGPPELRETYGLSKSEIAGLRKVMARHLKVLCEGLGRPQRSRVINMREQRRRASGGGCRSPMLSRFATTDASNGSSSRSEMADGRLSSIDGRRIGGRSAS